MAKPTPEQRRIAHGLRRILCGKDNPTRQEIARCRPRHVSYEKVADMCGYAVYDEIPQGFCDAVIEAGYEIDIIIGCGERTVIVAGDFAPHPAAS